MKFERRAYRRNGKTAPWGRQEAGFGAARTAAGHTPFEGSARSTIFRSREHTTRGLEGRLAKAGAHAMSEAALSRDTLVLNRSWVAIATTPARHALSLLFTGSARAIQTESYETHDFASWAELPVPDGEPSVQTVRSALRVPEVVVLTRFGGVPRQSLPFTRRNLLRRDRSQCQYCGRRPTSAELSIDHVVPRALGGETSWENCVLACVHCNRRKGAKLVHETNMRLMRPPRAPQWSPIFEVAGAPPREAWRNFVSEKHWSSDRTGATGTHTA